jgi:hypothetical protein
LQPLPVAQRELGYAFLPFVVHAQCLKLKRQDGEAVRTDNAVVLVDHPLKLIAPERVPVAALGKTWDQFFSACEQDVRARPIGTVVAYQTARQELRSYASSVGIFHTAGLAPTDLTNFVRSERGLAISTMKRRLSKVRHIFDIAVKVLANDN